MLRRLLFTRNPAWGVLLAAAGLAVLCYGLLVPWLGFYWDDISYQYSLRVFGPMGFVDFVARDRPFSAWIYVATSTLFGDRPLPYQVLNLGLRLGGALALGWLLRLLWPRGRVWVWAPLAFVVYPGFLQQPISFIYNLHWANLLQELLSLGCILLAVRAPGRKGRLGWSLAALALMLNVFSLEYAFGLETLRPLLLFLVLGETVSLPLRLRLLETLKRWLPYLVVNAVFLSWTLVFFNNNMYDPGASGEAHSLLERGLNAVRDLFQAGLLPWVDLFRPLGDLRLEGAANRLFWLVVILGGAGAAAVLWRFLPREEAGAGGNAEGRRAALVGLWALAGAGIPFWGVGLDPAARFPYDRFLLPFSVGAAILAAAAVEWLVQGRGRKLLVFSAVIGLACGAQFQNTNAFRREWENLRLFLAQLAWRAPGIDPGTLLLTHGLPFNYYSDYSLSGLVNMQYAPGQRNDPAMPYFLMYIGDRTGGSLPGLRPGLPVEKNYRSFDFTGSTSRAMVLFYSPPGCLRILDPARPHELPPGPEIYHEAMALSKPELIRVGAQPAEPRAGWFGQVEESGWCYAFEQADLARQRGDWAAVRELGEAALAREEKPASFSELGVFVEALARQGDEAGALEWLRPALDDPLEGRVFACAEWAYLRSEGLVGAAPFLCVETR